MQITCVTFRHYFPEAERFIQKEYPGQGYQILEIRQTLLNPLNLLGYLFKKSEISFALIMDIESGEALDIAGALVSLSRAKKKFILDTKRSKKTVSAVAGFGHLKGLFIDAITFPFAFFLAYFRLTSLDKRADVKLDSENRFICYLRTDLIVELKSGGSVAHTTGVIKGFLDLGYKPEYYGALKMKAVEQLSIKIDYVKRKRWLRNLPELPCISYSETLLRYLKDICSTKKPGLVYQRYSLNNYTGAVLAEKINVPFVLEYNGSEVWIAKHWGTRLFFEGLAERIEISNLKAADLVVVVSQPMKDELVSRGIEAEKVLVNPNGVDPEQYSPSVDGSEIQIKCGIEDKTVIGFIGTFGRWHGAEVLAEAFGRLVREFPQYRDKVRLLMIGDGITMPEVKENLKKYGVEDISILTGLVPQEDGPKYLAACDILASPHVPNPDGTPFFGSPTKLFEYMAMGKGIVASDLDQIGEILEHNKTAWMVKPGDAESLMLGLKALIDGIALRNSLGLAAREEAIAKYTWAKHVQKIISALEKRTSKERV